MKWVIFILGFYLFIVHIINGIEGGENPEIKQYIETMLYGISSLIIMVIFVAVLHIEDLLEKKK